MEETNIKPDVVKDTAQALRNLADAYVKAIGTDAAEMMKKAAAQLEAQQALLKTYR